VKRNRRRPFSSRLRPGPLAGRALGLLLACTAAASARPVPGPTDAAFSAVSGGPPSAYAAQTGHISLAQATALAQQRYKGRVVRAETVEQGGRTIYEIRILGEDGRVHTVRIDAESGAFL
jgi:hypothetical protein